MSRKPAVSTVCDTSCHIIRTLFVTLFYSRYSYIKPLKRRVFTSFLPHLYSSPEDQLTTPFSRLTRRFIITIQLSSICAKESSNKLQLAPILSRLAYIRIIKIMYAFFRMIFIVCHSVTHDLFSCRRMAERNLHTFPRFPFFKASTPFKIHEHIFNIYNY